MPYPNEGPSWDMGRQYHMTIYRLLDAQAPTAYSSVLHRIVNSNAAGQVGEPAKRPLVRNRYHMTNDMKYIPRTADLINRTQETHVIT